MNAGVLLRSSLVALLLLPLTRVADGATRCCVNAAPDDEAARVEFVEGVHRYAELHRMLAAPFGPEQMCSDPEELRRSAAALADAIREARATARLGDIFTARVATFFRAAIAGPARTWYDVPGLLEDMDEEGLPVVIQLEVNGEFPWSAGITMPPRLLHVLPALPQELEYRFVGGDLVLLDVRANLIVDVLEDALPALPPAEEEGTEYGPCDVHPEMPGCWM